MEGVEQRLEDIVNIIQEYAALHFGARAQINLEGDVVDAVAGGVNFLGEELEASFSEIERRVADRTAELAIATRELSRQALHDQLTGLPNRTLFWDRLSHRMSLADRRPAGFAVLFLDLDNFKAINDTLGHAVGDRLLVDVAGRIRAQLRAEVLRAPFEIGTDRLISMASIGVAVGPESFQTADAVVAAADAAMYDAKRRGPGRCVAYSKDRHGHVGLPLPAMTTSPTR